LATQSARERHEPRLRLVKALGAAHRAPARLFTAPDFGMGPSTPLQFPFSRERRRDCGFAHDTVVVLQGFLAEDVAEF
jgi:hypothetical protein